MDALRWLKLHHPHVAINDKWSKESQKQDFDLHVGFMKSTLQVLVVLHHSQKLSL